MTLVPTGKEGGQQLLPCFQLRDFPFSQPLGLLGVPLGQQQQHVLAGRGEMLLTDEADVTFGFHMEIMTSENSRVG